MTHATCPPRGWVPQHGGSGWLAFRRWPEHTLAFHAVRGRWTELELHAAPSPRAWRAMAYDPSAEVIVLFGGGPSRTEYTAETWILDPLADTWSRLD